MNSKVLDSFCAKHLTFASPQEHSFMVREALEDESRFKFIFKDSFSFPWEDNNSIEFKGIIEILAFFCFVSNAKI